MDDIAQLPLELILSYLPAIERIRVARVCRRWAALVRRPEFWRGETYAVRNLFIERCIQRGGDFELLCKQLAFAPYEIRGSASSWLKIACRAGRLRAAKSLSAELNRTSAECSSLTEASSDSAGFGDDALGRDAEYHFHLEEGPSLLSAACASGSLEVAQWLAQRVDIYRAVVLGGSCSVFHAACRSGNAALVRWLGDCLKISENCRLSQYATESIHAEAVINACSAGDLTSVEWLTQIFDLSQGDAAIGQLEAACARGHLHVAQWVATYYGLAREIIDRVVDAKTYPSPLLSACRGGHTAVVAWLIERFCYIGSDLAPVSGRYGPLELAQISGNLELVQMLHDRNRTQGISSLTLTDRCVFHFSARDPDAAIPRWLTAHYGLGRDDIDYDKSLANACSVNQLAAVKWFVGEFYSPACTGRAWLCNVRSAPVLTFLDEVYHLSALDIAAKMNDYISNIEELNMQRWMIDKCGAELHDRKRIFVMFLSYLAQLSDSVDLIEWLVSRAADIVDLSINQPCGIVFAANCGRLRVIKWLVGRYGGAINGEAAFVEACSGGHIDLAIFLADHYGLQLTDRKQLIQGLRPGVVAEWLKQYAVSDCQR